MFSVQDSGIQIEIGLSDLLECLFLCICGYTQLLPWQHNLSSQSFKIQIPGLGGQTTIAVKDCCLSPCLGNMLPTAMTTFDTYALVYCRPMQAYNSFLGFAEYLVYTDQILVPSSPREGILDEIKCASPASFSGLSNITLQIHQ